MRNRRTTEDFILEMHEINPNIEILGDYISLKTKVHCRCKKCENEWSARPDHLLNNHGCPECKSEIISKKRTKSHEQFIEEMSSINPTVTILGTYQKSTKRVACICNNCGFQWEGLPSLLLKGTGCPNCSKTKQYSILAKTHEAYNGETVYDFSPPKSNHVECVVLMSKVK